MTKIERASEGNLEARKLIVAAEQEQRMQQFGPFLAGMAEVGGSMQFGIKRNSEKGIVRESGVIKIEFGGFNDEDGNKKVDLLVSLFGGKKDTVHREARPTEYIWRLPTMSALAFATAVEPYMKSRQAFLILATDWENLHGEDRVMACKDYMQLNRGERRHSSSVEAYSSVVKDGAFLTGALYGRATRQNAEDAPDRWRYLQLNSANSEVLEAFKAEYGGVVANKEGSGGYTWGIGSWHKDRSQAPRVSQIQDTVEGVLTGLNLVAESIAA